MGLRCGWAKDGLLLPLVTFNKACCVLLPHKLGNYSSTVGAFQAAPIRGPWWYQLHHRVCCLAHKPCGQRRCVWCGLGLWMSAPSALILTTASGMSWCVGPKHVSSYSVWHARVKQIWEPMSMWPIILLLHKVFIKFWKMRWYEEANNRSNSKAQTVFKSINNFWQMLK